MVGVLPRRVIRLALVAIAAASLPACSEPSAAEQACIHIVELDDELESIARRGGLTGGIESSTAAKCRAEYDL